MSNYIALIRSKPSSREITALRAAVMSSDSAMLFLHGEGVAAIPLVAWAPQAGAKSHVCQTSWNRRRPDESPRLPVRTDTLATFYQAVQHDRRVDSIGLGGSFHGAPEAGVMQGFTTSRLLLDIAFAPADAMQHRETLEMALGAAALEINASVLFRGQGVAHLAGDAGRGWRQITDPGLLQVYADDAERPKSADRAETFGAARLKAAQVTDLRADAGTILVL